MSTVSNHPFDRRVHVESKVGPLERRLQIRGQRAAALAVVKHVGRAAVRVVLLRGLLVGRHLLPPGLLEPGREHVEALALVEDAVGRGVGRPGDAGKRPVLCELDVAVVPSGGEVLVPVEGVGLLIVSPQINLPPILIE
jgi:hypothetical protein